MGRDKERVHSSEVRSSSSLFGRRWAKSLPPSFVYKLSNQINDSFLCFHIRFDIALGGGERSVSSEHLNVPERPSDSRNRPRGVGDERATS